MSLAAGLRSLPGLRALGLAPVGFLFGVDLRTLALFRIGLGGILIVDLVLRGLYMRSFYTDFGILPRYAYYELENDSYRVSLHAMGGSLEFQAILFLIAGALALALAFGFFTRTVTVLSWLFLMSLEHRLMSVGAASDVLLRVMLFWAMFLPLGARFSLDAKMWPDKSPTTDTHLGFSSAAILLQPAILYLFTAILKTDVDWWADGTAVYFALHLDSFASPFGRALREFPGIMYVLTRYVLIIEFAAPLLLFLPFLQPALRIVGLVGLFGMHLGFLVFMKLELFPLVSWLALVPLIPGFVWNSPLWPRLDGALPAAFGRLRAYAGDLSDRLAIWARANIPRRPEGQASVSERTAAILRRLRVYAREGTCLAALVIVILWNVAEAPGVSWQVPQPLRAVALTVRLDQYWSMFAPRPTHSEFWYVIRGELENGEAVDVYRLTKGEPKWEKPADPYSFFESRRWRKFLEKLPEAKFERLRLFYGRYLCRKWNEQAQPSERLNTFEIGVYQEENQPDYRPAKFYKKILWFHNCGLKSG